MADPHIDPHSSHLLTAPIISPLLSPPAKHERFSTTLLQLARLSTLFHECGEGNGSVKTPHGGTQNVGAALALASEGAASGAPTKLSLVIIRFRSGCVTEFVKKSTTSEE